MCGVAGRTGDRQDPPVGRTCRAERATGGDGAVSSVPVIRAVRRDAPAGAYAARRRPRGGPYDGGCAAGNAADGNGAGPAAVASFGGRGYRRRGRDDPGGRGARPTVLAVEDA